MTFTSQIEIERLIKAWTKNSIPDDGDARLLMDLMNTIVEREAIKIGLEQETNVNISRDEWDYKFGKLHRMIYEHYGWKVRERVLDTGLSRIDVVAEVGWSELPPKERKRRE